MRRFTTPFTCSICKTEFCNPISLVKHVELEHPTALKLSTINITRTEHRTYSGLLIESIIVSEFKDSNTLPKLPESRDDNKSIEIRDIENCIDQTLDNTVPILSEKQVHEESLEIGDLENCIEKHSNNMTDISVDLPILSEKQIHKESHGIEDIENLIEEHSDNKPKDYDTVSVLSEKQFHEESLEIGTIENCNEDELSNNMTKISNALPSPYKKQIDKESLESGNKENNK